MSRVTTTRDRRSDVEQDRAESDWAYLSLFGSSRGVPWWAAVLLAFGVSILTAFVSRAPNGQLGWLFNGGYFLSCVLAVCWVQRKSLFGPMVQPPLVAVVVVPTVALMTANTPASGGMTARLLTVAQPLVTSFPAMAVTTAATVLLGVVRIFLQKRPAAPVEPTRGARSRPARDEDEPVRRPAKPAADERRPAAGRTAAPRPQSGGRPAPRDGGPAPRGGGGASRGGAAGGGAAGRGAAGGGAAPGGGRPVPPRGGQPGRQQPPPPQRGGPAPRGGGQPPRQQPPAPRRRPPREDDY